MREPMLYGKLTEFITITKSITPNTQKTTVLFQLTTIRFRHLQKKTGISLFLFFNQFKKFSRQLLFLLPAFSPGSFHLHHHLPLHWRYYLLLLPLY